MQQASFIFCFICCACLDRSGVFFLDRGPGGWINQGAVKNQTASEDYRGGEKGKGGGGFTGALTSLIWAVKCLNNLCERELMSNALMCSTAKKDV